MKHIDDYSVHDDLPESLNRPNAKELAELWDKIQLKFIDSQIRNILIYPVIDELPSDLVDALAIQLHCDFYDKSLSIEARRQIVKTSIAWHRIKGTPAAVEMLTQTIFHDSHTKEWFEYNGRPYFFRMVQDISDGTEDVTRGTLDLLKKAIWMGKNVRSWLEMLEFLFHTEDTVTFSEEISELQSLYAFSEYVPYGHRIWVPERDGHLFHGGIIYRDGSFSHDGELCRGGIVPGDWPYHHGWDDLSMDELFAEALFSFFDDVTAGGIFHDGWAMRNGEFFHGGADALPADLGIFGFGMRYRFTDAITPPAQEVHGRMNLHLADIIPYGTNPLFDHSGTAERGGSGYQDGRFARDGAYIRDGPLLDVTAEHGGRADLEHDHLALSLYTGIEDDASTEIIARGGGECHEGEIEHGKNTLPRDRGIHAMGIDVGMEEDAEPIDMSGNLSILCHIQHWGDFRRDGEMERGSYSLDDDLGGCLSVLSLDRSGNYAHEGDMERAADGRRIAI